MAGFNLTRFNFKAHGFAIFAFEDIVNAYEDEGLILYPGHIAIMNLNVDDNSCFVFQESYRAKLGYNEDGATINKTGLEVAHERVLEIINKGSIINLMAWDTHDTHEKKDSDAETAKLKADLLPYVDGIEFRTKNKDADVVDFEFYDVKNKVTVEALSSSESDFKSKFSQMLSRYVATSC
jgi:hypothetical protein